MPFIWKKWIAFVLPFLLFSGLMLFMDSCMQFRMSKSEIDTYFLNKEKKGVLHQYPAGKRTMSYLEVGDGSRPLVVFVHGSPGSLSAFIDFMADSVLLSRAQLISVDRAGFGQSNFGYAERSLKRQAEYLKPILEKYKNNKP